MAPVFVPKEEQSEYYIPAGRWTSFFSPERTVQGPTWIKEVVPLDEIPVWVRPGTILCLGPERIGRPDYDYSENIQVQIYELADGQSVETDVPRGKGLEIAGKIRAERAAGVIKVTVAGGLSGISTISIFSTGESVKDVVGGKSTTEHGFKVDVEKGANEVAIHLV